MSTRTKTEPRAWDVLLRLFPGTLQEMADALGISRQTLWVFVRRAHARRPLDLLRKLHAWLHEHGTADGSKAPALTELVRAWNAGKEPQP